MTNYVEHSNIKIDTRLYNFVNNEAILNTGIEIEKFWSGFADIICDLAPVNRQLIEYREELQKKLDSWHIAHRDNGFDNDEYKTFLTQIGYLIEEGDDFNISTDNVDPELSTLAGPQLVVPITNARFALNAANARWGSLYDALYGTDAIANENDTEKTAQYNPRRGGKVVEWAKYFLDNSAPLDKCQYAEAKSFRVVEGKLIVEFSGGETCLTDPQQFAGYRGDPLNPETVLLKKNNLHIELVFDRAHPIGRTDAAGIADVILESALTTIMDCEDSVATVDAEDKVLAYQNWLGLMRGDLVEIFNKDGTKITRRLNPDREYTSPDGSVFQLSGRAVMLIRNVGHLMSNPSIVDRNNNEVPEGIMDCVISALISLQDIGINGNRNNSAAGSLYIVKPKMHGPEEVAFATLLFERTEKLLQLPANTLKMGIMDEERRTTVNLKECIRAAKSRVVFINTGFLDRTGDEIHTSMQAGPMIRKGEMKQSAWINAYENWNVDVGLLCGLSGKAQIGKGMWAMPDLMADMLEQKIGHPKSGANTAWVPSPTAATLHATHYHQVNVSDVQKQITKRTKASIDNILAIPVSSKPNWTPEDVQFEIDNCAQTILGYVVRWVDQGVGCSKVPDINDIGLMEDRATLRISSQFLANWILHGVCSEDQVLRTLKRMAKIVDQQNSNDINYSNMTPDFEDSLAFTAACDLIFRGVNQPSGYTEPILHKKRIEKKSLTK